METFFDSRIDLLQRRLQKHSDRLKSKAQEAFKIKDLSGDLLSENFDREVKDFKLKVRDVSCCAAVGVYSRPPSLPMLIQRKPGFDAYIDPRSDMAFCQGRTDARKGLVLLQCYDSPYLGSALWDRSTVRPTLLLSHHLT